MGMLARCRDPSEEPPGAPAAWPGDPSFPCDDLAELASINFRNCSLFIATAAETSCFVCPPAFGVEKDEAAQQFSCGSFGSGPLRCAKADALNVTKMQCYSVHGAEDR